MMRVEGQLFAGEAVPDVLVFGQLVDTWIRPVRSEIRRREAAGGGAVTSEHVIRALMELPAGLPIPLSEIHPLVVHTLEQVGEPLVEIRADDVVRLATPPVELAGIVKYATQWSDVQAVSLLRTHAPRLVVARQPLARQIMRAADPDIGVAQLEAGTVTVTRKPGQRWVRPSWQRWLIAETAFAAWQSLLPSGTA